MTDDNLETPDDDSDEPDFLTIYEPHVDGDGWQMTPRMAWQLWSAALYLADEWRTSQPDALARTLPPIARSHVQYPAWRGQFAAGFVRIATRLADADDADALARCTAEELALHLTIDLAERHAIDGALSPAAGCHLPEHGRQDRAFDRMRESLFEDHDFLLLYNPSLDGIETELDGNPLLHPRDWFTPFR
jgi:hypothetical protein